MHQASRERGWHLQDALRDAGTEAGLNGEHLIKQEGAAYRDHTAVGACGT